MSDATPLDYFKQFIDDTILVLIVQESNLYSSHSLDIDKGALKAFLDILIIMGFYSLPSLQRYWSSHPNFCIERIFKVFTLKSFLKILRLLQLNDNSKPSIN